MAIKLKAESWHYKFFHKNFPYSEPPKTLCPYFWILVGLIIAYPFFKLAEGLSSLSDRIAKMFPKKEKPKETYEEWQERWDRERAKEKIKEARLTKLGNIAFKIFLFGIAPLCILYAFYQLYLSAQVVGWMHILTATGIVVGIIICLVGIVCAFQWFADKYFEKIGKGIVKFSIFIFTPLKWIGWMIKALYEKACPLVQWEGIEEKKSPSDWYENENI